MKTKITDWLLKIIFFDEFGHRDVTYQTLYDVTYETALATAESFSSKGAVVRIYEYRCNI